MVRLQNLESLDRYVGYWDRFICYCLRVAEARGLVCNDSSKEKSKDKKNAGPQDSLKLAKFSSEQEQRLQEIWGSLLANEDEEVQV